MRILLTAALVALGGCGALGEVAPTTTNVGVPEAPCDAKKVPARPTFPADTLTGTEDVFTKGAVLWADRLARIAYELKLETIVDGCTKPPA